MQPLDRRALALIGLGTIAFLLVSLPVAVGSEMVTHPTEHVAVFDPRLGAGPSTGRDAQPTMNSAIDGANNGANLRGAEIAGAPTPEAATVDAPPPLPLATPRLSDWLGNDAERGDLVAKVQAIDEDVVELAAPPDRGFGPVRLGDLQLGERTKLQFNANANRTLEGSLTRIGSSTIDAPGRGNRTLQLRVLFGNETGMMKSTLPQQARLLGEESRALELLTRRVHPYVRVEFSTHW